MLNKDLPFAIFATFATSCQANFFLSFSLKNRSDLSYNIGYFRTASEIFFLSYRLPFWTSLFSFSSCFIKLIFRVAQHVFTLQKSWSKCEAKPILTPRVKRDIKKFWCSCVSSHASLLNLLHTCSHSACVCVCFCFCACFISVNQA